MFEWDEFYTKFKVKMENTAECTVGRYVTPKEDNFPYVDVSLGDLTGTHYDLMGEETAQIPLIVIDVYDTGEGADSTCYELSEDAKNIMLSYGFRSFNGPMKITNAADVTITRWTARYQRTYGGGDQMETVNDLAT